MYFQSPEPLVIVDAEGPRTKPGGLFLARSPLKLPEAYFGRGGRVSERVVLPSGCPVRLQSAENKYSL